MGRLILVLLFFCNVTVVFSQKVFSLYSPDNCLEVRINIGEKMEYSVWKGGERLLCNSSLSMLLGDGQKWGHRALVRKIQRRKADRNISSPFYKKAHVKDCYNELELHFRGDYGVIFRAYNDGVAYRFISTGKKSFVVKEETVEYCFPDDWKSHVAFVRTQGYHKNNLSQEGSFEDQFFKSFVNTYSHVSLSEWDRGRLALVPIVVSPGDESAICIAESDVLNYPGLYFNRSDNKNVIRGVFAPYPKEIRQGGFNDLQGVVYSREPYIARCEGARSFPWRVFIVANQECQLADNDMIYRLASPSCIEEISWIKPGKCAWEWWNDCNLTGVDFRTGLNNETYRYFIDFASSHGLEYLVIDEGWSARGQADLFSVVPEIDLEDLIYYARQKNVGIILWAGYYAFYRNMEAVCRYYSELGVKGFKIDFMDRNDQLMVAFHEEAARVAAKYKLLIDFHGTYPPTGLQRTYPNVVNFEAVQGLEHMKWAAPSVDQVTHDVTIPFIRMVAGPFDYTPGAMRNAIKSFYRPNRSYPMSQGTRCRQMAEYVVFESPLSMLCDSPTEYENDSVCTDVIVDIPTVWDSTIVLNGKIGKYVTIARKKGNVWYVGAMTDWSSRKLSLDLSFLDKGDYVMEMFQDGKNADRVATDYKRVMGIVPDNRRINIDMAPGGGCVFRVSKK